MPHLLAVLYYTAITLPRLASPQGVAPSPLIWPTRDVQCGKCSRSVGSFENFRMFNMIIDFTQLYHISILASPNAGVLHVGMHTICTCIRLQSLCKQECQPLACCLKQVPMQYGTGCCICNADADPKQHACARPWVKCSHQYKKAVA